MGEMRVNRASQHFTTDLPELFSFVIECNNFGWTNKGEIQGVEKENNIFSLIITDTNFTEVIVVPCSSGELWGWFSD